MTDTTPTTKPAKKRGRPPINPDGAMTASERSARRRAALSEVALHGQPSAAWGRVELLKALSLELATLDLLPSTADRSRAAQIVTAIMAKYELQQIEWNFEVTGETA